MNFIDNPLGFLLAISGLFFVFGWIACYYHHAPARKADKQVIEIQKKQTRLSLLVQNAI